jgi:hypothetical protein
MTDKQEHTPGGRAADRIEEFLGVYELLQSDVDRIAEIIDEEVKGTHDALVAALEESLAAGKALMNIMSEMDVSDYVRAELWLEQLGVKKGFGARAIAALSIAKGSEVGE